MVCWLKLYFYHAVERDFVPHSRGSLSKKQDVSSPLSHEATVFEDTYVIEK